MARDITRTVADALDRFEIELPSWGFANTGTRFGKFLQPAAATTLDEKLADAGQVHAVTGACPTVALHVLWDLPNGVSDADRVAEAAARTGVRAGAINPNVFQDQEYKFGSLGNPDPQVRERAIRHCLDSVAIGQALRSRDVSLWFADGSNYPGTPASASASAGSKKGSAAFTTRSAPSSGWSSSTSPSSPPSTIPIIADWGMALLHARAAGPQARVLVDTGHHYPTQNIEQIVAWLLDEGMLGGFHFNDRRYADDDLTLGSIDPYQVFRIFHEILFFEWQTGARADIAYMVDQSHNLKGKIEAMIQTVMHGAGTSMRKRRWWITSVSLQPSTPPRSWTPSRCSRMRSPPTCDPPSWSGGRAGAFRPTRSTRFVRADTSSASRANAASAARRPPPPTPETPHSEKAGSPFRYAQRIPSSCRPLNSSSI